MFRDHSPADSVSHPGGTMWEGLNTWQTQPSKTKICKSEWQRKDPRQNKSLSLEMSFPTFTSFFLSVGFFFSPVSFHGISLVLHITYLTIFFILFHFKTIKTICHLVNTNIFSFLDQSVSCLCCNGSLTLFFLQDRQETL